MKNHPSDQLSVIRVDDGSGFHNVTDWIMAALLLGAAGLAVWYFKLEWNFDFDSPKFNPMVFVPIFLGGYGLYHLSLGIRGTLRARSYGLSTLEIHNPAVRMGETIKGVIRAPVELRPLADYVISLQCIETFDMMRDGPGLRSGNSTRDVDRIRWEASTRVVAASVNSKNGIPFEFTLPQRFEEPQPSNPDSILTHAVMAINIPGMQDVFAHNQRPNATRWVMEIKAPLKGIDYYAIFGVIVEGTAPQRDLPIEIM